MNISFRPSGNRKPSFGFHFYLFKAQQIVVPKRTALSIRLTGNCRNGYWAELYRFGHKSGVEPTIGRNSKRRCGVTLRPSVWRKTRNLFGHRYHPCGGPLNSNQEKSG